MFSALKFVQAVNVTFLGLSTKVFKVHATLYRYVSLIILKDTKCAVQDENSIKKCMENVLQ